MILNTSSLKPLHWRSCLLCWVFLTVTALGGAGLITHEGMGWSLWGTALLGLCGFVLARGLGLDFIRHQGEADRAKHLSEVKSRFLANMSHEIRTPLGSIMGFAGLMEGKDLPLEERRKYLKIIRKAGEDLTEVINDILDISKIESGHLSLDKIDISMPEFLSDLKKLLNPHLRERNVALIFESDLSFPRAIHTDPLRLRQILMNLLGNSLKFTGRGRVSLKARREERFLVFDVEDTGIGISPQSREVIFKPFEQGEKGHAHKFGGTGLGIPLSQHLARLLGGDLQLIWSEPGQGSHFRVRVEYEEASIDFSDPVPEAISAPLEETPPSDLRGMKVLAVDDSEDGRHLIAAMLTEKGCEVELAENGREALEKALSRPFDVVLMDLQMPVMDGVSAVKTLRSKGSQVPVVALTARAMREDSEECMRAGFSDFLSKPIEYERLVGAVSHYRSRRSLQI